MVSLWRLLALLLLWFVVVAPLAAAVEVSIDRNPVQVNESFQLVFSLDQSPGRDPDFSVLQQDFMVLGNNRSNSISIINGEYQRSVKWTLQLMAKQIGKYTIPAIRFGDVHSEPFEVSVQPSSLASVPHDQQVLELMVDRSEVHVQEQVILTMRLLSATDIAAYQFGKIPAQDLNVVIEPLGDLRQYQTRIADRSYLVLEQQFALFPQQSGQLEIPPVLAEVRLPSRSRIDPFNNGGDIRRFRSQPVIIDVKPIPQEFSGDYWLPADHVELREQWPADLTGLVAGEPVTRSITLIADGLTAAQLPEIELQAIDGVKQYPDQPVLQDSRNSKGMHAQRVQKVALIPAAPGVYRIPEISVNWWNRATAQLETTILPARELVVGAGVEVAEVAPTPLPLLSTDQVPQSMPAAVVVEGNRFWLWLSLLLACGWATTAIYWWFATRRNKPVSARESEVVGLRETSRVLRKACENDDSAAARAALLAWGQCLMMPRRVDNLGELVDLLGDELGQQVEALNHSRYAGQGEAWEGRPLWALCQRLQQQAGNTKNDVNASLLPLNP
ncbi:MAG: BatD family protein [Gammaproteobacteria bacterium]|jgi:hypothetical protein|nr:BatD family protein [Gammaproteobacteria bacterium]